MLDDGRLPVLKDSVHSERAGLLGDAVIADPEPERESPVRAGVTQNFGHRNCRFLVIGNEVVTAYNA